MKHLCSTLLAIILLVVKVHSVEPPSLIFNSSSLTIDENNFEVTYPGFQPTSAGQKIILCSQTYLIKLEVNEQASWIHYNVTHSKTVGFFNNDNIFKDKITSASRNDEDFPVLSSSLEKAGSKPVEIIGEIRHDNYRYAVVLIYPVTLDTTGNLFFHREINIYLGDRLIPTEQLLTQNEVYKSWPVWQDKTSFQNSLSGKVDYAIITCPALAASFAPLATYKSTTGYNARVIIIDDVLTAYSGRDDAEKLREYLKDFYAQGGRYVLMGGDETNLPIRYAYHYRADEPPTAGQLQICDLYFADLTGDWDVDNDNIWGENYDDNPDFEPELYVGRLPFFDTSEVKNYTENLITYETSPGNGDRSFLEKSFFFSSDQMRDYSGGGQHGRVARHFPTSFDIDTVSGIEQASGDDPAPTNLLPEEVDSLIAEGFGIINIIAHGRCDGFVVRSANYNEWPKNYFLSAAQESGHGSIDSITSENKPAFFYSIACNNGAFDFDQPSYAHNRNMCQYLLGLKGGAVAFVAQSRWGWVGASYLLQVVFYDSLFAHPEKPAIDAMYASKRIYYYYRDLVLGQNFYGDPTLKIYTAVPGSLKVALSTDKVDEISITVTSADAPVVECRLVITQDDEIIGDYLTDVNGQVVLNNPLNPEKMYIISAIKDGYVISRGKYINLSLTGVEDQPTNLPGTFNLMQNYPNPFNPSTIITFELPRRQSVDLSIYNVLGQKVITLIKDERSSGTHETSWNGYNEHGQEVAGGIYFYRLTTNEFSSSKKMILLR